MLLQWKPVSGKVRCYALVSVRHARLIYKKQMHSYHRLIWNERVAHKTIYCSTTCMDTHSSFHIDLMKLQFIQNAWNNMLYLISQGRKQQTLQESKDFSLWVAVQNYFCLLSTYKIYQHQINTHFLKRTTMLLSCGHGKIEKTFLWDEKGTYVGSSQKKNLETWAKKWWLTFRLEVICIMTMTAM